MGQDEQARPAFEEAAEAELDRLRRELDESRQRRRRATEAFEAFVRSFRETPERSTPAPRPIRTLPREPRVGESQPGPAMNAADAADPAGAGTATAAVEVVPPVVPAALRPVAAGNRIRPRTVGMLIALAAAGLVLFNIGTGFRVAQAPPADRTPPPEASPQQGPPQVAAPAPSEAVAAPGLTGQLVTLRPVWVRVLVDGERTVERELPAGQKIPLRARETIAIRAGDAGAVRVTIEGQDQGSLGADGAVATRTFTRGR